MKLFNDLLQAHGYETLQTKDGAEAMDMTEEHHPDLILMDIQLPKISGPEITRQIKQKEELKSIPVIAVIALHGEGDEEKIMEGGCDGYISKPIDTRQLPVTVREFLERDTSGNQPDES